MTRKTETLEQKLVLASNSQVQIVSKIGSDRGSEVATLQKPRETSALRRF